jgi:vacuolar-type H+-ATPase subunit I/STV1
VAVLALLIAAAGLALTVGLAVMPDRLPLTTATGREVDLLQADNTRQQAELDAATQTIDLLEAELERLQQDCDTTFEAHESVHETVRTTFEEHETVHETVRASRQPERYRNQRRCD